MDLLKKNQEEILNKCRKYTQIEILYQKFKRNVISTFCFAVRVGKILEEK